MSGQQLRRRGRRPRGLCNGVGCVGEWDAEAALAERARIAVLSFERSEFRARRGHDITAFGDFGLERSCCGDGSDDGSLRLLERVEGWLWGGAPSFGEVPSAGNRRDVSLVVAQDAFEGVAGDVEIGLLGGDEQAVAVAASRGADVEGAVAGCGRDERVAAVDGVALVATPFGCSPASPRPLARS